MPRPMTVDIGFDDARLQPAIGRGAASGGPSFLAIPEADPPPTSDRSRRARHAEGVADSSRSPAFQPFNPSWKRRRRARHSNVVCVALADTHKRSARQNLAPRRVSRGELAVNDKPALARYQRIQWRRNRRLSLAVLVTLFRLHRKRGLRAFDKLEAWLHLAGPAMCRLESELVP
jgi:hypothetical protein